MKKIFAFGSVFLLVCGLAATVAADAPSGAIFTTLPDGSEVNQNVFPSKEDVYLDGGPGIGAPPTAAGLDDGIYVFQVTDPSGKKLLSTDPAACRRFTVAGGLISDVIAAGGCEHLTGTDIDHNATTVQLMPFLDTPNNGGVYKAWAIRVEDFLLGCAANGENSGLEVVDCGYTPGNPHGFLPSDSKTDNFKVRNGTPVEIDTRYYDTSTGSLLDALKLVWIDTLGSSNTKWSYYAPQLRVDHWAHVEGVEVGIHRIVIDNQPGCKIVGISYGDLQLNGPGTVKVTVKKIDSSTGFQGEWTKYIYVYCDTAP
jgi:hypothetical protein